MAALHFAPRNLAEQALAYIVEKINKSSDWHAILSAALSSQERGGSLKKWIEEGQELETLQLSVVLEDGMPVGFRDVWKPGARLVDHVAATFFTQNGSRRDFAGIYTLVASDNLYIGYDGVFLPDALKFVIYRVLS